MEWDYLYFTLKKFDFEEILFCGLFFILLAKNYFVGYLYFTLKKFDFRENLILWVRQLYSSSQASVRTNNINSEYFNLHQSTRQGSPLSPLLFSVGTESLSVALRSDQNIKNI